MIWPRELWMESADGGCCFDENHFSKVFLTTGGIGRFWSMPIVLSISQRIGNDRTTALATGAKGAVAALIRCMSLMILERTGTE